MRVNNNVNKIDFMISNRRDTIFKNVGQRRNQITSQKGKEQIHAKTAVKFN